MDLEVFGGGWAGVAELKRTHGNCARTLPVTTFLKYSHTGGGHAVYTPVSGSMTVANGDGESSKVCTNHLDHLVVAAGNA